MKLFVGLGNPGGEYAGHRHNIGFMALDRIAADHGFGPWKKGTKALISEGRLGGEKVVLLKPQTFMNASGEAVQAAMAFYKLPLGDLTVFHDELDLAPFKVRFKQGGGHAGHNGLRSLHAHIGDAYARVRLGIGHPGHKDAVAGYVLHNFAEAEGLDDLLRGISDGAEALAAGDAGRFMNAVALRVVPQRPSGGSEAPVKPKAAAATPDGAPDGAPAPPEPPLSALQRLAARFRG
jgi:peptidyl-tRNA hydrolase, PTH1 family